LNTPQYLPDIVMKGINIGLEKKDSDRDLLTKLFLKLAKDQVLTSDQVSKGIQLVLEPLEDIVIDIPNSPIYVANFIGSLIVGGSISLASMEEHLSHLVASATKASQASNILAEVFHTIGDLTSDKELRDLYVKSKLNITNLLKPDQRGNDELTKYLEEKDLTILEPSLPYAKGVSERKRTKLNQVQIQDVEPEEDEEYQELEDEELGGEDEDDEE